jgi:hypothetical protein
MTKTTKVSTGINDFPIYGALSQATYAQKEKDLLDNLRLWYASDDLDWANVRYSNVRYSKSRLRSIIDMVERRRLYFHVFHNGMDMGEMNEACLYCFWILKLYPFFDAADPDIDVNRFFALELFTNAITYTADNSTPKGQANFGLHIMHHLLHAFRFRDLSKEAMMALAESLIFPESAATAQAAPPEGA